MKERVDDERIEEFLDSLWQPRPSLAQRAVAAYFVRTHGEAIEAFINRRIELSGANYSTVIWAKKTRKLLKKAQKGPRGYAYNPGRGTLETLYAARPKTFRLSGQHHHSLTLPSRQPAVVWTGYVMASLCIVVLLWMGYVAKRTLEEAGEHWIEPIENLLAE